MNRRELQKYKDGVKNATSNFSKHSNDLKKDMGNFTQANKDRLNKMKNEDGLLTTDYNKFTMSVEESDQLFGKTAFGFNNLDEVNTYKEQIDYALEHQDSSAFSEAGIFDIPAMIGAMLGYLTGKYTLEYKMILGQAKELNDLYVKIEALIKTNKTIRFKHRNDKISCSFSDALLAGKNSKTYYLTLSQLGFDTETLGQKIDTAITQCESMDGNKMDNAKELASVIVKGYDELIKRYNPELDGYTPIIRVTKYNNAPLEKVIKIQKAKFGADYSNIYTFNKVLSIQAIILKSLQQQYEVYKNRYKTNKPAMYIVDTVYAAILGWQNQSMTFNSKCMDVCTKAYKADYEELVKIYDYLKQFA